MGWGVGDISQPRTRNATVVTKRLKPPSRLNNQQRSESIHVTRTPIGKGKPPTSPRYIPNLLGESPLYQNKEPITHWRSPFLCPHRPCPHCHCLYGRVSSPLRPPLFPSRSKRLLRSQPHSRCWLPSGRLQPRSTPLVAPSIPIKKNIRSILETKERWF